MGVSLPETVITARGKWALFVLLLGGAAGPAAAQAPSDAPSTSAELPRFMMRQLVLRRNDALRRIPGPWVSAALAMVPESLTIRAYRTAASRSGIKPLRGGSLKNDRSQHVMGLYRRAELVSASRQTLESIRAAIQIDSVRTRFDAIFRPNGEWIVDLHEAALVFARRQVPSLEWGASRPALVGAHWVAPTDSVSPEALPRAVYGLAVLAENDSAAFAAARARLWQTDSASAKAALLLMQGYVEGRRWYAGALDFFLREHWLPQSVGTSIRDRVQAEWGAVSDQTDEITVPDILPRWFGYPQAVPRYGVPAVFVRQVIVPVNPSASAWLERHGQSNLLRTLKRLPFGDSTLTLLRNGSETLRLTTVTRQAKESLNGFLEPQDAIAIDPGYMPLLAVSAIVHEWQHLLFHRAQLELRARSVSATALQVELPGVQPHLAEGFAEWSAERILAPLAERWPLLSLGELEKRADMAQRGADDQHALGYALVQALALHLPQPAEVTSLLLQHAEQPGRVLNHRAIRKAWSKYKGVPDRNLPGPTHGTLVPEVTFTVEDGYPDVLTTRIHVAPADASR